MTWGPITATSPVSGANSALATAFNVFQSTQIDGVPIGGALDQVNSCLAAAQQIAASGVCGANPQIVITGHANVNHVPTPAGHDTITITITDTT